MDRRWKDSITTRKTTEIKMEMHRVQSDQQMPGIVGNGEQLAITTEKRGGCGGAGSERSLLAL